MLLNLSVKNIVLIKYLDLSFDKGLTVFTGETGAGKSILLDALALAIGGKSTPSIIRKGETTASVSAVFNIEGSIPLIEIMTENEIPYNDGEIILRRVISSDGKSKSFINDIPVSIALLKEVGEILVEIHGQFDNQGLMNPSNHIKILDEFGGLTNEVSLCKTAFTNWKSKEKERIDLEQSIQKAKEDEEYIRYNLEELEKLNPVKDEESILSDKRKSFMQNKKSSEILKDTLQLFNTSTGTSITSNIRDIISGVSKLIHQIQSEEDETKSKYDEIIEKLETASDIIDSSNYELDKILSETTLYENIDDIEERLFKIRELSRKHNCLPNELSDVMEKFKNSLNNIENSDIKLKEIIASEQKAKSEYFEIAKSLHDKRTECGKVLSERINKELPDLKLEKANFTAQIIATDNENEATANGIDSVQFVVSTNVGMQSGLIHKIASGGELARFMLAIKVVLAKSNPVSTYIFDELDTGISGATSSAVGEKLYRLSENIQVMLVTHSAQVASFGTSHFKLSKKSVVSNGEELVETSVEKLTHSGRLNEIARIISDDKITDTALQQAAHLLDKQKI